MNRYNVDRSTLADATPLETTDEALVFENNVLASASPTQVECSEDIEEEMESISRHIATTTSNWKDRVSSLKKLRSLVKGDAHKYPVFWELLWEMRTGLASQICELRSAVCKEACITLCFLAISTRDEFEPVADFVIPHLLKIVSISIMIISHSGNVALRTILRYTRISKGVTHILNASRDRNNILRVRSMEYIQLLLEVQSHIRQPYMTRSMLETSCAQQIRSNISDANESVRLVARRCVWALDALSPNVTSVILSHLDASNAKRVQDERLRYRPFGPIIGKGHKINCNFKSTIASSNFFDFDEGSTAPLQIGNPLNRNRPKTAVQPRHRRLESLKKKLKQDKTTFRRFRPQSANATPRDVQPKLKRPTRIQVDATTPIPRTRNISRLRRSTLGSAKRMVSHELFSSDASVSGDSGGEYDSTPVQARVRKVRRSLTSHDLTETPRSLHFESDAVLQPLETNANLAIPTQTWHSILEEVKICSSPYLMQQHLGALLGMVSGIDGEIEREKVILEIVPVLQRVPSAAIFNVESVVDSLSVIMKSLLTANFSPVVSCILQLILHWLKSEESSNHLCLSNVAAVFCERAVASNQNNMFLENVLPCLSALREEKDGVFIAFEFISSFLSICRREIQFYTISVLDSRRIIDEIVKSIIYENDTLVLSPKQLSVLEDCLELCVGLCENQNKLRHSLSSATVESLMGVITSDDISHFLVKTSLPTPICPNKRKHRLSLFGDLDPDVSTPRNKGFSNDNVSVLLSSPPIHRGWTAIDIDIEDESNKENNIPRPSENVVRSDGFDLESCQSIDEKRHILKDWAQWISTCKQSEEPHVLQRVNVILTKCVEILNSDEFDLHRRALKIIQSICLDFNVVVNNNVQIVLQGLIKCFRECAPRESGECAQDVMSQFTRAVHTERCLELLLCIIRTEFGGDDRGHEGKEIFACLNILDRLMVQMDASVLKTKMPEICPTLVQTYLKCKYREAMRSLIYAAVILDDDSFLHEYPRVQQIVGFMRSNQQFVDWVNSHQRSAKTVLANVI